MTPSAAWAVFPLFRVVDGVCACSKGAACEDVGKHPRVSWGQLGAGEKLEGRTGEGLGIATGSRSGVFVLDLDRKPGKDGFATLEANGWDLPATYTVATPSGGVHLYFRLPPFPVKTSGGRIGPGVDVRGEGGYVVAAGSPGKSAGSVYTVIDESPIVDAPAWLLEHPELQKDESLPEARSYHAISETHPLWDERNAMAVAACRNFPASQEGGEASLALGSIIKRLVWDLELPPDRALELILEEWNPRCTKIDGFTPYPWSEEGIARTISRSLEKNFVSGVAPAGWLERFGKEVSKPTPANVSKRRQKNPSHQYTCTVGDVPNGDKTGTTFANMVSLLSTHEDWEGVWAFDLLKNKVRAVGPPIQLAAEGPSGLADHDADAVVLWFELLGGFAVTRDMADRAILSVARKNEYNPIEDWLATLPANSGPSLFEGLSACVFGASKPLYDLYLRRFMVGAIRRALQPGTKLDNVLVLQSPKQGDGKSTFVKALFGEEWSTEDLPESDIGHKDNAFALASTWGVELAELDKLLRGHSTAVKSFLTRCVDTYRPPYGRHMVEKKRQCVFVGTTNETDFLRDPSGSRRFWCIPVGRVDLEWLRAHRDQLWAEAYALYLAGETHWLTPEEELERAADAEQFGQEEILADPVTDFCKGKTFVKLADVLRVVRLSEPHATEARAILALKRIGCVRGLFGTERIRAWGVPERISTMQQPKKATQP